MIQNLNISNILNNYEFAILKKRRKNIVEIKHFEVKSCRYNI